MTGQLDATIRRRRSHSWASNLLVVIKRQKPRNHYKATMTTTQSAPRDPNQLAKSIIDIATAN